MTMFSIQAVEDLEEALRVQFGELPSQTRTEHVDDLIDSHRRGRIQLTPFGATDERKSLIAVQTFALQRDGTSHVYPVAFSREFKSNDGSAIDDRQRQQIVAQLFTKLEEQFNESNAWIAQSMLKRSQRTASAELTEHGFPLLTDLLFMELSFDEQSARCAVDPQELGLTRVAFESNLEDRFARLLETTYVESTDCPELNGRRSGLQALASHKLSGDFSSELWSLFERDGEDIGVLLLSEHGSGVCEIVYLGLAAASRRQGYGSSILDWGLSSAAKNGNESVMLGVDVRNHAAIKMYQQAGFQQFDRRIVHARFRL
jgi:ribosomal protein S18 acetylase RimI-like enzyme